MRSRGAGGDRRLTHIRRRPDTAHRRQRPRAGFIGRGARFPSLLRLVLRPEGFAELQRYIRFRGGMLAPMMPAAAADPRRARAVKRAPQRTQVRPRANALETMTHLSSIRGHARPREATRGDARRLRLAR